MSKSKPLANPKPARSWQLPALVAVVALSMAALGTWGYQGMISRLVSYGDAARGEHPEQALVYYRTADRLSAAPTSLVEKEAAMYVVVGNMPGALKQWKRLPNQVGGPLAAAALLAHDQPTEAYAALEKLTKTPEVLRLLARAELEQGNATQAVSYTQALSPKDDSGLLGGLALLAADMPSELGAYMARQSDSEAVKTLMYAKTNKTALAAVLHAQGLERSAERVLQSVPVGERTSADERLLGEVLIARANAQEAAANRKQLLTEAVVPLLNSLNLNPADAASRDLLMQVYTQLGRKADAAEQEALLKKLHAN